MTDDSDGIVRFSTYIYKIISITDKAIDFTSLTDLGSCVHTHKISPHSTFPFERLKTGQFYAIVSAKPKFTWHFLIAFSLDRAETIYNDALLDLIEDDYGIVIDAEVSVNGEL
jgi:hypothetical protein